VTETVMTEHVRKCVKLLNERLQNREVDLKSQRLGYEATFELLDMPWDGTEDEDWREGYETCMADVADAVAQAWGLELPRMVVKK